MMNIDIRKKSLFSFARSLIGSSPVDEAILIKKIKCKKSKIDNCGPNSSNDDDGEGDGDGEGLFQ